MLHTAHSLYLAFYFQFYEFLSIPPSPPPPPPPPLRGVDDILPIMSYVIIRSALPQLVSETALMEEFIQDG